SHRARRGAPPSRSRSHRRGLHRRPPLHGGTPRSRSPDPHQRRDATLELHAVAARLHRALDHEHPVAGLPAPASLRGRRRLPESQAAFRTAGLNSTHDTEANLAARPAAKSSTWALPLRIASGIAFVPILILLARVGGPAFLAFVGLQVTLALRELFRM